MFTKILDRVGEWNPQLFRETKGRLKPRNIAIASVISLLFQGFIYLYFSSALPIQYIKESVRNAPNFSPSYSRYCLGTAPSDIYNPHNYYNGKLCIPDALGIVPVNWQLWWLDMFVTLSIIAIIGLLTVGSYMLISDLSKEEKRGTLNFVRISPQSAQSILVGKILGVPILLYAVALLALPLHLIAGLGGGIPFPLILGLYGILAVSGVFVYSASLLFGLVSSALGGFQAWLGSGAVLFFLSVMTPVMLSGENTFHNPFDWIWLFYPGTILPYLTSATGLPNNIYDFTGQDLAELQWFGFSFWQGIGGALVFMIITSALFTYWTWQGLNRRFHNPSMTVWSKSQSYALSASLMIIPLGFATQIRSWGSPEDALIENFTILLGFELTIILGLIAALSPHRQTLQDWARYRHATTTEPKRSLIQDLILGEKSPVPVAIALNVAIISIIMLPVVLFVPLEEHKLTVLGGMVVQASLISIYAIVAQILLLMKTRKRSLWASVMVSSFIILPFISLAIFEVSPYEMPGYWLFSAVPIVGVTEATGITIFLSLLGQWGAIALLGFVMKRQLQLAGESATKALLSGRKVGTVGG